jgi:hypothetical protein
MTTLETVLLELGDDARFLREILAPQDHPSQILASTFLRAALLHADVERIFERFPRKWKSPASHRHVFVILRKVLRMAAVRDELGDADSDAILARIDPYCKLSFLKSRFVEPDADAEDSEDSEDENNNLGSESDAASNNVDEDDAESHEERREFLQLQRKYDVVKSLLLGLLEGTLTPSTVACRLLLDL